MRLRRDRISEKMHEESFRKLYQEMEPAYELARVLLQYRSDEGITQAELAKRIGMNRSELSKLESASSNPTLSTMRKVATSIGMKLRISFDLNTENYSERVELMIRPSHSEYVVTETNNFSPQGKYSVTLDLAGKQPAISEPMLALA